MRAAVRRAGSVRSAGPPGPEGRGSGGGRGAESRHGWVGNAAAGIGARLPPKHRLVIQTRAFSAVSDMS